MLFSCRLLLSPVAPVVFDVAYFCELPLQIYRAQKTKKATAVKTEELEEAVTQSRTQTNWETILQVKWFVTAARP